MYFYKSLEISLTLVKWLKISEIGIIKLERLSKRPRDKRFLIDRLNI